MATLYIYDRDTGKPSYTIDNATAQNIEFLKNKNIPYYLSEQKHKLIGTYVEMDLNTNEPCGIQPLKNMDSVSISKSFIIADGVDETTVSNIPHGTRVFVDNEFGFIANTTFDYIDLSANGYSLDASQNEIKVLLNHYGYRDVNISIPLVQGILK
jgi:hypothetical protein